MKTYNEMRDEKAREEFEKWWAAQGFECKSGDDWAAKSLAERVFIAGAAWGDNADLTLLRGQALLMVMGAEGSRVTAVVKVAAIRGANAFMGLGLVVNMEDCEEGMAGSDSIAMACATAYNMMETAAVEAGAVVSEEPGPIEEGQEGRPM